MPQTSLHDGSRIGRRCFPAKRCSKLRPSCSLLFTHPFSAVQCVFQVIILLIKLLSLFLNQYRMIMQCNVANASINVVRVYAHQFSTLKNVMATLATVLSQTTPQLIVTWNILGSSLLWFSKSKQILSFLEGFWR